MKLFMDYFKYFLSTEISTGNYSQLTIQRTFGNSNFKMGLEKVLIIEQLQKQQNNKKTKIDVLYYSSPSGDSKINGKIYDIISPFQFKQATRLRGGI